MKLADFINNYPEREKLNKCRFTREAEGVYNFGTKKITISLSKHNETLQVRKGGGFQGIEEFVDEYADLEIVKVEKKDADKKGTMTI